MMAGTVHTVNCSCFYFYLSGNQAQMTKLFVADLIQVFGSFNFYTASPQSNWIVASLSCTQLNECLLIRG